MPSVSTRSEGDRNTEEVAEVLGRPGSDIAPADADQAGGIDDEAILAAPILIVDDSEISRDMLGAVLESIGYHNVDYACDGLEALEKLTTAKNYQLVILDLSMPNMDGFEVCRRLRADEDVMHIPVLVQSGLDSPEQIEAAFAAGATDMVSKPIKPGEFLARVRVHLHNQLLVAELTDYRARIMEELDAARSMQESIVPAPARTDRIAKSLGLEIDSAFRPCSEVGGDLWGLTSRDDKKLYFYTADFSGHGVAAAINTFRLHALLARIGTFTDNAAEFLYELNNNLAPVLATGQYATMLCGRLDVATGKLEYASAGAPPPLLISGGKDCQIEALPSSGLPLGILRGHKYELREVTVPPETTLMLYSDALIESVEFDGSSFDEACLYEQIRTVSHGPSQDFLKSLLYGFYSRVGTNLRDDLTVVTIRRPSCSGQETGDV